MAFRRAKTIDQIYDEVRDRDLVLTDDLPLAVALNRRHEAPRLGHFAVTPRHWALDGLDLADERGLFHVLVRETDLTWKRAATALGHALDAWLHVGRPDAILDHAPHASDAARAVVDVITTVPNAHLARHERVVDAGVDVAAVGASDWSTLDASVLPDDRVDVDPFAPGDHTLDRLDVLPSTGAIVRAVVNWVDASNANDVAVVACPGDRFATLVEAGLEAAGVPYARDERLRTNRGLRAFVRLLRFGLSPHGLTAREVRGLASEVRASVPYRDGPKQLDRLRGEGATRLRDYWSGIASGTLREALDEFRSLRRGDARELAPVRRELEALGILDEAVSAGVLDALDFYLDAFDVTTASEPEGVLLASATSSAYVDRAHVLMLGLGTSWRPRTPHHPWVDRTRAHRRELRRFERLVQSGASRTLLVQDTYLGEPVVPCFHFHELVDEPFASFTDLPHRRWRAPPPPAPVGFDHAPVPDVEPTAVTMLSPSDLDRYVYCPRDWAMGQLVAPVDEPYFTRGSLFHEFAEFAVSHADVFADGEALERAVEHMVAEMGPWLTPEAAATAATRFRIGTRNILAYLRARPPTARGLEGTFRREGRTNRFAELFDRPIRGEITERRFQAPDRCLKGEIDLVHDRTQLVDLKSTRNPDPVKTHVARATGRHGDDRPDHQPIAYLAHLRTLRPDEPLGFTFVNFLSNETAVVRGDDDVDDMLRHVPYRPVTFAEYVPSRAAFEDVSDSKARAAMLETLGYDAYRAFFEGRDLSALATWDADTTALEDAFEAVVAAVKDTKTARGQARGCIRRLARARAEALYRDDIDDFESVVPQLVRHINAHATGRFPVGRSDVSKASNPDLVLRWMGPPAGPGGSST